MFFKIIMAISCEQIVNSYSGTDMCEEYYSGVWHFVSESVCRHMPFNKKTPVVFMLVERNYANLHIFV